MDAIPQEKDILNGGTQSIMEVAAGLAILGQMKAKIVCLSRVLCPHEKYDPNIKSLNLLIGYDNFTGFLNQYIAKGMRFDSVVATYFVTVWMLKALILRIESVSSNYTPKFTLFCTGL